MSENTYKIENLEKVIKFNYSAFDILSKSSGVSAVGHLRQLRHNMNLLVELTGEPATVIAARLGFSVRMWQ